MKIIFSLVTTLTLLFGAPAFTLERTYTQSDGTTFKAKPQGDEYIHFLKTEDGAILVYNPQTKNFEYAIVEEDRLIPSGVAYRKNSTNANKSAPRVTPPKITQKELQEAYKKARLRFQNR